MSKSKYFKGTTNIGGVSVPWESAFPIGTTYDCERCGLCCFSIVQIRPKDAARLKRVGLSESMFEASLIIPGSYFPAKIDETRLKNVSGGACTFLQRDNLCSQYANRPYVCREFPFSVNPGVDNNLVVDISPRCPFVNRLGMPKVKKADLEERLEDYVSNADSVLPDIDANHTLVKSVGYAYDPAWLPNALRIPFMETAIGLMTDRAGVNNLPGLAEVWSDAVSEESHERIVRRDGALLHPRKQFKDVLDGVKERIPLFSDERYPVPRSRWSAILADKGNRVFSLEDEGIVRHTVRPGKTLDIDGSRHRYPRLTALSYTREALNVLKDYLVLNMRRPRYQVCMAMAAEYAIKCKHKPLVDFELEAEFIYRALIVHLDVLARVQAALHDSDSLGEREVSLAISNTESQLLAGYSDGSILAELKREIDDSL